MLTHHPMTTRRAPRSSRDGAVPADAARARGQEIPPCASLPHP
jgi:hypothetical protein